MDGSTPDKLLEIDIRQKRQIIDRGALQGMLTDIATRDLPAERERAEVLASLKAALAAGQAEVRGRLETGALGTYVVRANSFLVDQIVRAAYDYAALRLYPLANPSKGERLALVAVGGYGRGELAPHSDVDLLFLLSYKMDLVFANPQELFAI